jgi:hypothetical protein
LGKLLIQSCEDTIVRKEQSRRLEQQRTLSHKCAGENEIEEVGFGNDARDSIACNGTTGCLQFEFRQTKSEPKICAAGFQASSSGGSRVWR